MQTNTESAGSQVKVHKLCKQVVFTAGKCCWARNQISMRSFSIVGGNFPLILALTSVFFRSLRFHWVFQFAFTKPLHAASHREKFLPIKAMANNLGANVLTKLCESSGTLLITSWKYFRLMAQLIARYHGVIHATIVWDNKGAKRRLIIAFGKSAASSCRHLSFVWIVKESSITDAPTKISARTVDVWKRLQFGSH